MGPCKLFLLSVPSFSGPSAAPCQAPPCPGRVANGSIFKGRRSRTTAGERVFSGPGTKCLKRVETETGVQRGGRGEEVKESCRAGSDGSAAPFRKCGLLLNFSHDVFELPAHHTHSSFGQYYPFCSLYPNNAISRLRSQLKFHIFRETFLAPSLV